MGETGVESTTAQTREFQSKLSCAYSNCNKQIRNVSYAWVGSTSYCSEGCIMLDNALKGKTFTGEMVKVEYV